MSKHVSYVGKIVFLGIDVHREFFVVSVISEGRLIQACRVPGRFEPLYSFITKYFERDSLKLAQQLSAGRLRGIRIPSVEEEERRLLTRTREQLMRAKRRVQVQIRMRLNQFGLIPSVFSRVMTRQRAEWFLKESKSAALKHSIEYLMNQWAELEKEIKRINREIYL